MGYKNPSKHCITLLGSNANPNDSTTYYIGAVNAGWNTNAAYQRIYPGKKCTLREVHLHIITSTTGTNEPVTANVNVSGGADTLLSNTLDLSATNAVVDVTNLNLSLNQTDYVLLNIVCPAWVNNPVGCYACGYLVFDVD